MTARVSDLTAVEQGRLQMSTGSVNCEMGLEQACFHVYHSRDFGEWSRDFEGLESFRGEAGTP